MAYRLKPVDMTSSDAYEFPLRREFHGLTTCFLVGSVCVASSLRREAYWQRITSERLCFWACRLFYVAISQHQPFKRTLATQPIPGPRECFRPDLCRCGVVSAQH